MSAICQNFTQNAWKKELCSNCFKSKDEHMLNKLKPLILNPNKAVEGIIKTKRTKPKRTVCFTSELSKVIGYGGEDWSSDPEDESNLNEPQDDDDDVDIENLEMDREEDRELSRLTKANTDFNMTSLKECMSVKKTTYTQLMLGKPQMDADGRKQTLLVSVTPFGQEKKHVKTVSHIPVAKNNKELGETKTNVVLTSYTKSELIEEKSLLDEISETLENSKNPIQIMKKVPKEVVTNGSDKENSEEPENEKEEGKPKPISERKNGLTRAVVIKREEKPVVFQTSTAKIELLNTKNAKLNQEVTSKFIKTERIFGKKTEPKGKCDKGFDTVDSNKLAPEKILLETKKEDVSEYPTREQVGEPDGRADPDVGDPPALPLCPPPALEIQSSFLHGTPQPYEKPKLPIKPVTVVIRKPVTPQAQIEAQNHVLSTFSTLEPVEEKTKLSKQDSNDSELGRVNNKRRAPKPPEEIGPIFTRNSTTGVNLETPVLREKEKRERASSCSPKMSNGNICSNPDGDAPYSLVPEPVPRKLLSLSTDSLASNNGEDKRIKDKANKRFSLKKFLRMGTKDVGRVLGDLHRKDEVDCAPQPKPRLVIVHPSDLNGAQVQIVPKPIVHETVEYSIPKNICTSECTLNMKAAKPPPPPRNISDPNRKVAIPTPPKSAEILHKQKQLMSHTQTKKVDSVYANIGEVRNAITPNKPQRTASMREREEKQRKANPDTYNQENVYDYINGSGRSSSPEYDSSSPDKNSPTSKTARQNGLKQRSESNVDVSGDYFKYQNIPRSMSLTYCGSETESEIYSPYSCYGSESEVTEDDHDWITPNGRTHKLRSRKGRSIVHKNLEDNYGAVIVANHEALAQVLENVSQIQHSSPIQPALRGLKAASNLRWSDFSIKSASIPVIVGTRVFHQALWGAQHVTLVINASSVPSSSLSLGTFSLAPITEFSDLIPSKYLPVMTDGEEMKHIQATVAVLPWMQVNTLQSFGEQLKMKTQTAEETWKEASFVLLQLVNALKTLQAQGIEELPLSLTSFILCKEVDRETTPRLYALQSLGEEATYKPDEHLNASLCMCASKAVSELLPPSKQTQLLQSRLNTERAVSLTQVKSVLEFTLWGPSDVALGSSIRERELALQRWLDLQRATVLHGLVCARVHLTVQEQCHLLFLVRSNAKMMCDASLLLEASK